MTNDSLAPLFHGGRLKRQRLLSAPIFLKSPSPLLSHLEQDLAERLEALRLTKVKHVLLYGARTPLLVERARSLFPHTHITLADPVFQALPDLYAQTKIIMNEKNPCFAEESFDLIISCATLAFSQDPLNVLHKHHDLLKPDGVFLTSFFGGNTLQEISAFLLNTELTLTQGASQRIMPMIRLESALALLQGAGFQSPLADHEELLFSFKTLQAFRDFLKTLGAQAPLYEHPLMSKALYQAITQNIDLSKVTFDLITLIGWKTKEAYPSLDPDLSQA